MRFCYQCKSMTEGSPSFCAKCGRSYNAKLCSRGHENPRDATFCAKCGTAELSTPARRKPRLLILVQAVMIATTFCTLVFASISYAFALLTAIIQRPNALLPMLVVGLIIGVAWLLVVSVVPFDKKPPRRRTIIGK